MSYEYDPNAEPEPFCQYCGCDEAWYDEDEDLAAEGVE